MYITRSTKSTRQYGYLHDYENRTTGTKIWYMFTFCTSITKNRTNHKITTTSKTQDAARLINTRTHSPPPPTYAHQKARTSRAQAARPTSPSPHTPRARERPAQGMLHLPDPPHDPRIEPLDLMACGRRARGAGRPCTRGEATLGAAGREHGCVRYGSSPSARRAAPMWERARARSWAMA